MYSSEIMFKLTFRNIIYFLSVWLLVGFTIGFSTLMGPVSWIRSNNFESNIEGMLVRITIIIFIVITFLCAAFLVDIIDKTKKNHVKYGIPTIWIIFAISVLWLSINPALFEVSDETHTQEETSQFVKFTFGEYPDEYKLNELKKQGFTSIVSLLHPAVVPFEPKLIEEEKINVESVGLEFIHIPMVPWVSENTDAVLELKELAIKGTGKYYVHCYLGKDRIRLAKTVIQNNLPIIVEDINEKKSIRLKSTFERGEVIELDENLFVIPYPTDDEFLYIISDAKYFLSLLNPLDIEDLQRINEEKIIMERYNIPYENIPVTKSPFDSYAVYEASKKAKILPKPLFVHSFFSNNSVTDSFVQAYLFNKPCTSYLLFKKPINNGPVELISPDVVVGPIPTEEEYSSYLYENGIRRVIYVGNEDTNEARIQRNYARASRLIWYSSDQNVSKIKNIVSNWGPWYIYGPKLNSIKEQLKSELGPSRLKPTYIYEEKEIVVVEEENTQENKKSEKEVFSIDSFILKAIPSIEDIILFSLPLALYIGFFMKIVGYIHQKNRIPTPYTRKIFHFGTFISAAIIQITGGLSFVILYGVLNSLLIFYVIYRKEEISFYHAIARQTDGAHKSKFILIPLVMTAIGGLASNILFGNLAIIGYLIVGVGDAIGEPVGTKWGRHRYKVPSLFGVPVTRSIEGSISVCLTSIVFSSIGLYVLGTSFINAIELGIVCGIVAALTESISNHGLDNITVQIIPTAILYLIIPLI